MTVNEINVFDAPLNEYFKATEVNLKTVVLGVLSLIFGLGVGFLVYYDYFTRRSHEALETLKGKISTINIAGDETIQQAYRNAVQQLEEKGIGSLPSFETKIIKDTFSAEFSADLYNYSALTDAGSEMIISFIESSGALPIFAQNFKTDSTKSHQFDVISRMKKIEKVKESQSTDSTISPMAVTLVAFSEILIKKGKSPEYLKLCGEQLHRFMMCHDKKEFFSTNEFLLAFADFFCDHKDQMIGDIDDLSAGTGNLTREALCKKWEREFNPTS